MKIKNILTVASILGLAISTQASPITGGFSFAGAYTPSSSDLSVATSISFGAAVVTSANGTFAGFAPGTSVTLPATLAINPTVTPITGLWTLGIYSFNATSLVESGVTSTTITLTGLGTITDGTPADAVTGQYLATFNTLSDTYSFSASTGSVPDSSSTLMMLGSAMTAVGMLRRKIAA